MKFLAKIFLVTVLYLTSFWLTIDVSANAENCAWGICATTETLTNWTSKMNIYDTLWMSHKSKTWGNETSVMTFIQDIIYAATYFIGTVVTIALITSWLLYIFSWADSNLRNKAKNWFKYALIGLVIVTLSIVIVRTVQFLAGWGS
jgi:hypothetical protein